MTEKGLSGTPPAPARIWVLLASEASTAVIFRRGPSRWTRLYLWNTRTDEITPGSWFVGRLYEEMSDLAPDGEHLIYVARNESKRQQARAKTSLGVNDLYAWAAVCRPPWVKALGLWDVGGIQYGWATFTGNRTLRFLHGPGQFTRALIVPHGFTVQDAEGARFQTPYLRAMQRTGWRHVDPLCAEAVALWKFPATLQKGKLELRLSSSVEYQRVKEYVWHGPKPMSGLEGASWADIDQQGRLIYAREGRLYAFAKDREIGIADLNLDQPPSRLEAKTTD